MRPVLALALSLPLLGCAGAQRPIEPGDDSIPAARSVGAWSVKQQKSRLTDVIETTATLTATSAKVSTGSGFQTSILSISCIQGVPRPFFYFGWPIGRNGISVVTYRFDQLPARTQVVEFLGTEGFFLKAEQSAPFIAELRSANSLYIQIASASGSLASADFNVGGAADAIAPVLASCTPPPKSPGTRQGQKKRK